MNSKPRLSIILGATYTFSDLEGLMALSSSFDVTFHAFETPIIHHLLGAAQLKIYAIIDDMPSYMRGIEPELAGTDAILALGNQNISSFQACRAADKLGVPFYLIVDEMREVTKEQYGHIYVLQSEVLRAAEKVYPLSDAIRHNLLATGCAKAKIRTIPPFISTERYAFDEERRQKFRDYLSLTPDNLLILINQPLRAGFQPRLAMDWLQYLRAEDNELYRRTVVLYCQGGDLSRNLKSEALHHDLASHVRFLDQDTSGFVRDLYAAGDMVLASSIPCEDHLVEIFPRWQIEMIAAGMVPIYPAANPVKKFLKKTIHYSHDHDLAEIHAAVKTFVARRKVDSRAAISASQHQAISQAMAQDKALEQIAADIKAGIAGSHTGMADKAGQSPAVSEAKAAEQTGLALVADPKAQLQQEYVGALKAGDTVEALAIIEKLIDATRAEPLEQADGYFKKAELLLILDSQRDPFVKGSTGAAEEALEICLGLNARHNEARHALAKLWHEHERTSEAISLLTEVHSGSQGHGPESHGPESHGTDDDLTYLLAQCVLADGQVPRAIALKLELIAKGYHPQVVATRLCHVLEDYPLSLEDKIATLKQAFLAAPDVRLLRQNLIAAFLTAGMVEEGKAWIDEQDARVDHDQLLEEPGKAADPSSPKHKKAS